MNELFVFYGMLFALVAVGVIYSLRLYHKHGDKHGHRSSHG